MNVLTLLLGLLLVIFGAQFMVDGSVAVAKRYRMPEFLIGLTIVGIGTSMPELVVSVVAGLEGKDSIAIGNVVGSNLANILLILGATALIRPVSISPASMRTDIPYNIFLTVVLLFMCFGLTFLHGTPTGSISRPEGIVLLLLFAGYMVYSFRHTPRTAGSKEAAAPVMPMWKAVVRIAAGLAGLIFGGRWFVNGASGVAESLGMSQAAIAITIVAIGTSLPELATSVVAAVKGNTQLALGNVIGSNIFNIGLILGTASLITPLSVGTITIWDIAVTLLAGIMLWISCYTFRGRRVNRADGILFLAVYAGYMAYLLAR